MNQQYISDWSGAMGDTFAPLSGDDDGLIELLWCNGHVVMQQSQPLKKQPPSSRPDKAAAAVVQDGDTVAPQAWFQQYPAVEEEDPLERDDLFSELFGEAQAAVDGAASRAAAALACCKEEEADAERDQSISGMMPPPPKPRDEEKKACPGDGGGAAVAARTSNAGGCEAATAAPTATEGAESSMLTIGSSFCGSNHVQTTPTRARGGVTITTPPVTSSATRSRSCTTKSEHPGSGAASAAAVVHRSGKRKQISDATDAEDVEFESADVTCEPAAQKTTTAKRRRAAEVHNLSERRRRDRINEKMKALQELIPHCNKTDKASMLDEAIEYLKSLQLQLQMMWMGGGMAAAAPMVFRAGVHQYMQRMVAAGAPSHHVASLTGMPFMAAPPAAVHHHQGPPLPADLYARYLAVDHHLQVQPPALIAPPTYTVQQHCLQDTMGFYHQRQSPAPAPAAAAAPAMTSPSDGILQHRKYENCGKPEIQGMTG